MRLCVQTLKEGISDLYSRRTGNHHVVRVLEQETADGNKALMTVDSTRNSEAR